MRVIPYRDLSITDDELLLDYQNALIDILKSGKILNGNQVTQLEEEVSKKLGIKNSIGVSSGTNAIYLALKVLSITKGDEVILPCLSWIATANAIVEVGATPVFADIDNDLNISPESIERLITPKTKAIIPVHFMGRPAQMDKIIKIAKEANIKIIEDASQAFGTKYNGEYIATFGDINCISLNPMKNLNAFGDAGIITTNKSEYIKKLKYLRYCGVANKQTLVEPSLNHRIDSLQAAFISINLKELDKKIKRRHEIVRYYNDNLPKSIQVTEKTPTNEISYYGYTILIKNRESFIDAMRRNYIETKIEHAPLMNQQPAYQHYKKEDDNAAKMVNRIINIPCHEKLSQKDLEYIVEKINSFISVP